MNAESDDSSQDGLPGRLRKSVTWLGFTLALSLLLLVILVIGPEPWSGVLINRSDEKLASVISYTDTLWHAPDTTGIPSGEEGKLIRYGRELISRTAYYLGPEGSVAQISNGMNCQNCHLDAGTRPFGNNYSAVASTYPRFRARSGTMETMQKRVNDCIQRSLNGKPLDSASREMHAILAWFKWLGRGTGKGISPDGAGLLNLPFLATAADPKKGQALFAQQCIVCHGKSGEGMRNPGGKGWMYPPLWGEKSYNTGAGLYRLSRFAGYIKANMPLGATYDKPVLTDEEAWHIAAFVNSQPRPVKDLTGDWPDISKKPVDHPFGPYADGFTEEQHKYGPFGPIAARQKKK